jgi:alpha-1,3-mannosyltransferase
MEEVEGYESGERDYTKIQGCTGPLVYPAGFLYVFSFFKSLTENGTNILSAQLIFLIVYLLQMMIVLILYSWGKAPIITAFLLILSKRIHSIYMLRMFNDCIAIFLGYIAFYCFSQQQFSIGSFFYSFAVSIKMNMLLFAPGIFALYLLYTGYWGTMIQLSICASIQLIVGYPFLSRYPIQYLSKAFELSRVFMYKWTVNWKFLSEEIFLTKQLSIGLLLLTVIGKI